MRVLILVGNYVNVVDGVALTYGRLVRARAQAGDRLMVLGPGAARPALDPGPHFGALPSVPIPLQPEYRLALGIPEATRRAVERFEPELVHVASPDLGGLAALDYAAARGIPAVGAYHSEIARYLRFVHLPGPLAGVGHRLGAVMERAVWAWVRRFYSRCRHVYAPSAAMAEVLRARGIDSELRVWGRGVDPERFSPAHRDHRWRARLGLDQDTPLILFAARLRWEKGLELLAEVLDRLAGSGLPHRVAIAGGGPARPELEGRCPAHTLFLGELDQDELARVYASADLFLYPSTTETFGNVTLEAMASGLPTVCADATGSDTLVVPGETGELVAAEDAGGFVAAVVGLLREPERRRSMGVAARRRALAFSWARATEQLAGHWADALNSTVEGAEDRPPRV